MKFLYNTAYDPDFPAFEVILRNSDEGLSTQLLPALLDTGADGSLGATELSTRHPRPSNQ
ncbi:hypothetical protein QUF58_07155 [Anaerolineales bacterium HSG24]|nr:hypothetical protein [Anaerolineales bacterium HSG24]